MTDEEKAIDEWHREVARHVRGFKVSDLPMKIAMTHANGAGIIADFVLTLRIGAPYTDVRIGGALQVRPTMFTVEQEHPLPEEWSYWEYAEKVVPGETWSPLDMPNPRLYSTDGRQLSNPPEGGMAVELETSFKEALGCIWQTELGSSASIPVNERRSRVFALLDHHYSHGSNPTSFLEFIGELVRYPERMPPPPTEGSLLLESFGAERRSLDDPQGLSFLLNEWLVVSGDKTNQLVRTGQTKVEPPSPVEMVGGREVVTPHLESSIQGSMEMPPEQEPKPARSWPTLKSLALFHALRFERGDASADITAENESSLARQAGYITKTSGKELRTHYRRYAYGPPANRRLERTGDSTRPGDLLGRYDRVISMLGEYPEALALAKEERQLVTNRSHERKD